MKESSNPTQIPPQQEQNPNKNNNQKAPFHLSLLPKSCLILMTSSSMITMKFPSFTLLIQTKTTLQLSQILCLNIVLGRHSQEHPTNTKSIRLDFGTLPKLLKTLKYGSQPPYGWEIRAKETFKKSCLPPMRRFLMAQIIQCLEGKIGGFDQISNKDAIILYCLANRVDRDYARAQDGGALKKNQAEGPPFIDHMLAICNAKEPVSFKAPKTSSKVEKKSKIEITKGVSSKKGDTGSQAGHLIKETQSSLSVDSNPIQPSASTLVVYELHKEDQQETGGPTSLRVTIEEGAHPQLSSGMSASIHTKPIYLTSIIIYYESTSEHDVLSSSKVGADSGLSAPKDLISQTTCNDEGPNKLSLDHIFKGINPHVLVEKTKSTNERLETVVTQPTTGKGASDIAKKIEEEFNTSPDLSSSKDTQKDIKLKDLSKLVQDVRINFMDLDSPKDDEPIIVQDDSDEEVHVEKSQNSNLKKEKIKAKDEVSLFLAQPSYPNVALITKLLAKIKNLDALPILLNKVTDALNKFAQIFESASKKAGDHGVPLAGLAGSHPAEGEKNIQQVIIS
ncbi:hypothetical protein Tco_0047665 [Tanacetum coccineum]